MSGKHTPGPWIVDEETTIRGGYSGLRIADLYFDSQANARLIAAAPELLEACKGMFEVIEARVRNAEVGNWQKKLQAGRDAIIKAEGHA